MRAVLLAGPLAPSGALPPAAEPLRVLAPAGLERLAHSMAAAAGRRAALAAGAADAHAVLATDRGGGRRRPAGAAAAVRYDERVLRALEPRARVEVGSLARLMPALDWLADPGGMVAVLERPPPRPRQAPPTPPKPPPPPPPPPTPPRPPITLKVARLPKRPVGAVGPVRTVALDAPRLRGVPLRDGDAVLDGAGARWFVERGALWSHRAVAADRADALQEGRVVRAARAGGGGLRGAADAGDAVRLTLAGAGGAVVHGVLTRRDAAGWAVRADVDRSVVTDPRSTCFGARAAGSAAACVAAGGVWDRPCAADTECPYHDRRTGRGGCVSGTCEMPLGVGNRSFRTPDPRTPALCDTGRPDPWCDPARDAAWRAVMP